jgi:chromosomal replication initiator protein
MIQTGDGSLDPAQIWDIALKELQGQLTRATFDTWLRATFIADAQNGDAPTLVIGTHHPYGVDWLEHRLHETIQRTLVGIVGRHVNVKYAHVK